MKRLSVAVLAGIVIVSSMCYVQYNICKISQIKKQSAETLKQAYVWVETNKTEDLELVQQVNYNNSSEDVNQYVVKEASNKQTLTQSIISEDNIIGVLKIPKLNVEAPIKEGTSQQVMKTSIGHFIESDYWEGNVSLASHNGGTNAHYFEKINLLSNNDEIIYITKLGIRKYKVTSINKIKSTDWSMVLKSNQDLAYSKNTITLITCINGLSEYRLCVRGEEV